MYDIKCPYWDQALWKGYTPSSSGVQCDMELSVAFGGIITHKYASLSVLLLTKKDARVYIELHACFVNISINATNVPSC